MTIFERIANWLTGDKYEIRSQLAEINYQHMQEAWKLAGEYEKALEEIASIPVTASSNGQTRKAVRIAKEALA